MPLLSSSTGQRYVEHRVRKLKPHEQRNGYSHTVEYRVYDVDKGNTTVVRDWGETGFHGVSDIDALQHAVRDAGRSSRTGSVLGDRTLKAYKQRSGIGRRANQVNETVRQLEAMTTGGLKQQLQGKYVESLKNARLYTAAQTGKAPQDKIDAIVQPLKKQYEATLAKAQRVLKKATKRHARLIRQYYGPLRASE
jgi:enamine deaminase RidA (YjgF/YER057c/UK114 family)